VSGGRRSGLLHGAIAGLVGTASLHATTYLDMAVRGRPASQVPSDTVRRLAGAVGSGLADDGDEQAANRREGLGALLGFANGVGVGAVYGVLASRHDRSRSADPFLVAAATMIVSNLGAARLGVTDPRAWSLDDWLTDVVPHVVFGLATAATYAALRAPTAAAAGPDRPADPGAQGSWAPVASLRSTRDVVEDHLASAARGEVARDLERNYAPDVVLFTREGTYHGHDGARQLAARLTEELPGGRFTYRTVLVDGDVGFLQWTGESPGASVRDGVDTFVVRSGRIVAQTIHYTVGTSTDPS
jgi:hypothetical protein